MEAARMKNDESFERTSVLYLDKEGQSSTYCREESRAEASPAAEHGRDAHHKFNARSDQSNNVCNEHPLAYSFIGLQTILQFFRKGILHPSIFQAPNLHRIESEVGLSFGAKRVLFAAIPRAIIPKVDCVEIFNVGISFCLIQCLVQNIVIEIDSRDWI